MKLKTCRFGTLLAVMLLAACSKEVTNNVDKAPSSGKQVVEGSEYWQTEESQITPSVLITSKQLTEEGYQVAEQKMKETSLASLNLPSNLNVNAFTIRSKTNIRTKEAVYIAPKLYLYKKSDNARVQVKDMGDKVLVPLHAILVDGFSKQVPASDGINTIDLPLSYLVDADKVKNALVERGFSESIAFGPLDGCPKQFSISFAGETYDVTPKNIVGSDQCELNRPFTLNLIIPKDKADFVVNEALYFNEVDVQASFEVKVGFIEADSRIQLDRSKIYEKLSMSLSVQKPPYIKADIETNLKKIIQSEMLNVFIKGDRNDIVNQLYQAAYDSFVVPFELKASNDSAPAECTKTAACLNISYEKNTETRNLEVSYQQYSTTLTGQVISSFAKGQQILFPEVAFSSQTDQGKVEYVSNHTNNTRDLLITVNEGSVVEVHLDNVRSQLDNTKVGVSVGQGNYCGSRDSFKRCEWHLHWVDVTRTYSGVVFSEPSVPAGNMFGSTADELFLKIKGPSGDINECSFAQLNAIGNGNHYIIKLENSLTCKAFADSAGNKKFQYSVSFVNRLKDPTPLKQLNDGLPFSKNSHYELKDGVPAYDGTEYGGLEPIQVNYVDREIQLKLHMEVRKYDLSN